MHSLDLQGLCPGADYARLRKSPFWSRRTPSAPHFLLSPLNSSEPLPNPMKLGLNAPLNNEETVALTQ